MAAGLCNNAKLNSPSKLLQNVCRGPGDSGSTLNQQILLEFQYFIENDVVSYYSAHLRQKACLNCFVYKDKNNR